MRILFTSTAVLTLAACADLTNSGVNTLAVGSAFQSVPAGFSANSSSFDASGDAGVPFFPGAMGPGGPEMHNGMGGPGRPGGPGEHRRGDGDHRDGFGGPGMRGQLMGGGLGPDFLGRVPFGRGLGRGPFGVFNLPDACTFDATGGRVTCPDKTDHGFTISASFAFKDAAGTAQAKFDTTSTDAVNVKVTVSGTRVRRDSSTSTVDHQSDRSVSGLAPGSTKRTINGTARGLETTTGTRDGVAFTAVRTAGDTTTGLVIPIVDGRPTIPSAGVVVRSMKVTITPASGAATIRSRREQITFDGTNVVSVVITQDGVTKNCTITLPDRKLVCG
jgi:hypothetical protein